MGPKVDPSSKRKHQTLTLFQKLEIVKKLENGVSRHIIMKEYDIGSSTIYDIKKNKDKLKQFVKESETLKNLTERQTLKKTKLDQLDSVLYTWFVSKRSEGKPITGPMVIEKAKQFQQDLNIDADCKFSEGWLRSFKSRHGIRKLDISGELKSANVLSAEEFKVKFKSIVSENNLTACQIYNADETGLLWRCLPNSTLAGGDEKTVKGFKKNKDRLTVLLCSNSSGDHKLKPFVIGKSKQPRALKGVKTLPVIYGAQSNAWMEQKLFKNWFFQDFVPAVKKNFKKLKLPEDSKAVLFLDNCSAHPDEEELVSGNISVSYLPPNVTPLIQPMDQGAIQNFKSHYRRYFVQNLLASDCNVKDFQGQFSVKDAIFAIALAWGEVKEETLKKSWRKLWPEVMDENIEATDDSGSDPPLDELEVVLSDLPLENPMSQMNREEIREWIEVDCDEPTQETLTDETIIQSVLNPTAPKDVDSDEDDVDETNNITWNQAADALNTLIKFYERSSSFNDAEIMKLHIMRNDFIKKRREITKRQTDIRDMFKMASTKKNNPMDLDQPSCSTSE